MVSTFGPISSGQDAVGSRTFSCSSSTAFDIETLISDGEEGGPDGVFINGTSWLVIVVPKSTLTDSIINPVKLNHARLGYIATSTVKDVCPRGKSPYTSRSVLDLYAPVPSRPDPLSMHRILDGGPCYAILSRDHRYHWNSCGGIMSWEVYAAFYVDEHEVMVQNDSENK